MEVDDTLPPVEWDGFDEAMEAIEQPDVVIAANVNAVEGARRTARDVLVQGYFSDLMRQSVTDIFDE